MLTKEERDLLVKRIDRVIDEMTEKQEGEEKQELLTVKQCAREVKGLTEWTIRRLVKCNKIPFIDVGTGERVKILINKKDLLDYISENHKN